MFLFNNNYKQYIKWIFNIESWIWRRKRGNRRTKRTIERVQKREQEMSCIPKSLTQIKKEPRAREKRKEKREAQTSTFKSPKSMLELETWILSFLF